MGVLKGLGLSDRRPSAIHDNCSVFEFPSDTRPGVKHFTVIRRQELPALPHVIGCTCEGWQMNQKCWHVAWAVNHG